MQKNFYEVLANNDQLHIERCLGNIPSCLREGRVAFAPTFKRKAGDNTTYSVKRNPSWTDRILYCDNVGEDSETLGRPHRLILKSYDANNLVDISDHRPVFAQFVFTIPTSGDRGNQELSLDDEATPDGEAAEHQDKVGTLEGDQPREPFADSASLKQSRSSQSSAR